MVEDIILDSFPKEAGVYLFKIGNEVIYVGSSNNLHKRMVNHKTAIKKGSEHGYKQDLYQFLQSNHFVVEFQITEDYRQLEQELIEQYNPIYNCHRAYTGLGPCKGREAEYNKERYQKYKEEILGQKKNIMKLIKRKYWNKRNNIMKLIKRKYWNKRNNIKINYVVITVKPSLSMRSEYASREWVFRIQHLKLRSI